VSVRILLTGWPDEVAEAQKRVEFLFDVVGNSGPKRYDKKPGRVRVYIEAEVIDRG
jgi:hypothetical protein